MKERSDAFAPKGAPALGDTNEHRVAEGHVRASLPERVAEGHVTVVK